MSINVGDAVLIIRGDTTDVNRKLTALGDRVRRVGQQMGETGRSLTLLGAPITAIGALSVRTFAKFEQSMAKVQAVSGATEQQFQDLNDVAKEMGRTTVFTAAQSAQALSFMAMAGMDAEQAISALPSVLQLAAAGSLELGTAADIVTNVMAGFGLEVEELSKANDVLVTGFTSANTDLTQLGQAFKFAGPVARAAGISFEETTAILSLLGNAGLQATMAGTGLRGSITRLINPSNKARDVMRELGLVVFDAAGEMLPFVEIVKQLEASGLTAGQAMEIFGQRAGPAMLALVSQGSGALEELTAKMLESGGTAERIASRQLDTFTGSMTLLKSQIESVALIIGEILTPFIRQLAESMGPIINRIGEWIKSNPKLTVLIVALAAASVGLGIALVGVSMILPGLTSGMIALGVAVKFATGPWGILALTVAGLSALFIASKTDLLGVGFQARDTAEGIKEMIAPTAALARNFLEASDETRKFVPPLEGAAFAIRALGSGAWELVPALGAVSQETKILTREMTEMTKKIWAAGAAGKAVFEGLERAIDVEAALGEGTGLDTLRRRMETTGESFQRFMFDAIPRAEEMKVLWGVSLPEALERLARRALGEAEKAMDAYVTSTESAGAANRLLREGVMDLNSPLFEMTELVDTLGISNANFMSDAAKLAQTLGIEVATAMDLLAKATIPKLQSKLDELVDGFVAVGDTAEEAAEKAKAAMMAASLAAVQHQARLFEIQMRQQSPGIQTAAAVGKIFGVSAIETTSFLSRLRTAAGIGEGEALPIGAIAQAVADIRGAVPNVSLDRLVELVTQLLPQRGPFGLAGLGIPQLGEGAIVTRPTLAVIGDGGPEAVVPLGSGTGFTFVWQQNGPVFGMPDVEEMVGEMVESIADRGGFRGVFQGA